MTFVVDLDTSQPRTVPDPSAVPLEAAAATTAPASDGRLGAALFRDVRTAPAWLVLRLWLGYEWFVAGWDKLHEAAPGGWTGDAPSLRGFVLGADAIWDNRAQAFGHPGVHWGWFTDFLHFVADHGWFFGPLVVVSELLIGAGLLTGTLTRWAALGAVGLNVMYTMGGSAGVNGVYIAAAVLLVAAYRVAGRLGGDGLIRRRFIDRRQAAR